MTSYIALLRGINVGGHKIIKMETLRGIFEAAGLKEVTTYIQSGNVLFQSAEKNEGKLKKKIEKQLVSELGYEVEVFLRTKEELEEIVKYDPFKKERNSKEMQVYVAFLENEVDAAIKKKLAGLETKDEKLLGRKREVYVLRRMIPDVRPRFTNNFLEKELGQPGTTRNWATVTKLLDLASK